MSTTAQALSDTVPLHHILVVDDDITVRDILSRFLATQGYVTTACSGGQAMWAAIAARPADLVVLDVEMPDEDGYTLAYRLRAAGFGGGIIMLTSHTEVDHKVHGLEVGADDFLSKPCDRRELLARIKSLLRRAPPPCAPAPPPAASRVRPLHLPQLRQPHAVFVRIGNRGHRPVPGLRPVQVLRELECISLKLKHSKILVVRKSAAFSGLKRRSGLRVFRFSDSKKL